MSCAQSTADTEQRGRLAVNFVRLLLLKSFPDKIKFATSVFGHGRICDACHSGNILLRVPELDHLAVVVLTGNTYSLVDGEEVRYRSPCPRPVSGYPALVTLGYG
jgi:hypothetical protein